MENGRRWRELLPEGRYAWPSYDWNGWNGEGDSPTLIGYAVYWRRRNRTLSTEVPPKEWTGVMRLVWPC